MTILCCVTLVGVFSKLLRSGVACSRVMTGTTKGLGGGLLGSILSRSIWFCGSMPPGAPDPG